MEFENPEFEKKFYRRTDEGRRQTLQSQEFSENAFEKLPVFKKI